MQEIRDGRQIAHSVAHTEPRHCSPIAAPYREFDETGYGVLTDPDAKRFARSRGSEHALQSDRVAVIPADAARKANDGSFPRSPRRSTGCATERRATTIAVRPTEGRCSVIPKGLLFVVSRPESEELAAEHVIREHHRGRAIAEILDDPYVTNRCGKEQIARLLVPPELVHPVAPRQLVIP
jgi:hypothetical protein